MSGKAATEPIETVLVENSVLDAVLVEYSAPQEDHVRSAAVAQTVKDLLRHFNQAKSLHLACVSTSPTKETIQDDGFVTVSVKIKSQSKSAFTTKEINHNES